MSILLLGADQIKPIANVLYDLGAEKITHWNMRKKSQACAKSIPHNTDYVVMLTDYLHHNAMKKYKKEAKKRGIQVVCTPRSSHQISDAFKACQNKCEGCPNKGKCANY